MNKRKREQVHIGDDSYWAYYYDCPAEPDVGISSEYLEMDEIKNEDDKPLGKDECPDDERYQWLMDEAADYILTNRGPYG